MEVEELYEPFALEFLTMGRVQNIYFGPAPANSPPGTKIRRWDTAIGGGLLVGAMVFLLCIGLLWRPLPLLGEIDRSGSILLHARYWAEMLLAVLSGGHYFGTEANRYLDFANRVPFGMVWGRLLIAGSASFVLAFLITRALLTPRDQTIHVAGAQLRTGQDAQRQAQADAKKSLGGAQPFMRIHPSLALPKTRWTRHLLIYGSVGSGKTQILLPILRRIVGGNYKALLYDVKGDFTQYFPDALLISPWDARSAIWNVGQDVATREAAQEFAASLIPTNDKDPFWSNAAQFLLTGIVLSLQSERGTQWGWTELAERCAYSQEKLFPLMQQHYPIGANVIADSTSSQASSVIATFAAFTRLIADLAIAWGNPQGRTLFSLRDWLNDQYTGARQIILQAGKGEKLTSAYIAAMINAIVPEIVSPALPDNELGRTLFFVLDEFTSLSKIKIQPLIDKGRSKGCCVVLGFQDIAQVRKIYGADDAKSITSMVGTHIVCQVGPGETRDFVADKVIGKRRVASLNTNVNIGASGKTTSTSYHEEDRALLLPSQLTGELGVQKGLKKIKTCPHGFAIRALYLSGGDVLQLDWPGTVMPVKRPAYIEADWVKPVGDTGKAGSTGGTTVGMASAAEDRIEPSIEPAASAASTRQEVVAVISDAPASDKLAEASLESGPLTEAAHELVAGGFGGSGGEMVMAVGAALDFLTGDPPKPKPKVKVFTGNVSRNR